MAAVAPRNATAHAESLLRCIGRADEVVLPEELAFLQQPDAFLGRVTQIVDMPSRTVDTLLGLLRQNNGRLRERAREREFGACTEVDVAAVEAVFAEPTAA